jgi:hypothetical protein
MNEQKLEKTKKARLIAKMVYKVSAVVLLASGVIGVSTSLTRQNARRDLQQERGKVYDSFKTTDEFKQLYAQDLKNISEKYLYNNGTYEDFEKELTYINSDEYVKGLATDKYMMQIKQLDSKIDNIDNNSVANVTSVISAGTVIASATATAIGMAVEIVLNDKTKSSFN